MQAELEVYRKYKCELLSGFFYYIFGCEPVHDIDCQVWLIRELVAKKDARKVECICINIIQA